jgi:hypothetical protein
MAYAYSQLAMCAFSSAVAASSSALRRSVTASLNRSDRMGLRSGRVLGDPCNQIGGTLANLAVPWVIAHAAAVTHRERVLPRRLQGLELGSQGFDIRCHEITSVLVLGVGERCRLPHRHVTHATGKRDRASVVI